MGRVVRNHASTVTKFAAVGVLNTFIDAGLFAALVSTNSAPPVVANVISYSVGMLNSYLVNRIWTFRKTANPQIRPELFRFMAFNLVMLALSSAIVWQLTPRLGVILAKTIAVFLTFVFGYTVNRYFVFSARSKLA